MKQPNDSESPVSRPPVAARRGIAGRIRRAIVTAALVTPMMVSGAALAQQQQDRDPLRDADGRLWGYDRNAGAVAIEETSAMPAYLLLLVLTVFAVGVMFKNARRTHLD